MCNYGLLEYIRIKSNEIIIMIIIIMIIKVIIIIIISIIMIVMIVIIIIIFIYEKKLYFALIFGAIHKSLRLQCVVFSPLSCPIYT